MAHGLTSHRLISGLVKGPASSTDNAIARFDSTTGKVLQNSGVTIDDSNGIAGATGLDVDGGGAGEHIQLLNGAANIVSLEEDVSGHGQIGVRTSGDVQTAIIKGSDGSIGAGSTTSLIKWKTFSGTLGADGDDSIAHGLTATNIIAVVGNSYNTNDSNYNCQGFMDGASADDSLRFLFDTNNVRILYGSRHNSQSYRFIIFYV